MADRNSSRPKKQYSSAIHNSAEQEGNRIHAQTERLATMAMVGGSQEAKKPAGLCFSSMNKGVICGM